MKTFYREFATLINFLYWLPMFISVAVAIALSTVIIWWGGNYFKIKKIYKIIANIIAVALAIFIIPLHWTVPAKQAQEKRIVEYNEQKEKYEQAKAVFDEQCKKAGEKIYRTVDNVDGIILLKLRKVTLSENLNDSMWGDAAMITESSNGFYINSFLKNTLVDDNGKIYIDDNGRYIGGKPREDEKYTHFNGYQFVDVQKEDGTIMRYTEQLSGKELSSLNLTESELLPKIPARYAVTYENNIDPELRKHWVAGTTIKIIDRQTDELLAEKTIFAFARTMGTYSHGAWVDSRMDFCPKPEIRTETRFFVNKVLKPFQSTHLMENKHE